ncbi:ABC transporter substrate-binding protein [Paenibacillus physcomitrellae]|uniref:ABC transporter substrate-binding lipoprotein YhfQ n=1 Tax=Paenibacillus physcomitrellae TaxID=1619311 RepID=A0ABQ1FVM2_9BACL|nr:iron-siderophore ABC transporter substrate-binding protein [Paenibacillus physcomitrellae]GGA31417.1 putative ABC transporter substrate-binding lipoprotein YhfQ [Paenibacillus physcomitrellae]
MKKNILTLILFLSMLSLVVTGCGSANNKTNAAETAGGANAGNAANGSAVASAAPDNGSNISNASNASNTGTGSAAAGNTPIEVTNAWNPLKVTETPQKIITLDFSFIDTLTSLGITPAGNAGVGTTKIPEYLNGMLKSEVADVGERKAPNLEVIQSLKPDLIVASVDRHSMIRKELEDIGPTIAFDDASYDQIIANLHSIAQIVGKEQEADKVEADLNAKMEQVKQQLAGSPSIIVAGFFDDEFTVWVKDSFVGSLLSRIGLNYAYNGEVSNLEGKGEGTKMTLERIHEINPDYIMVYGDKTDKLQSNPLFKDLKAVKEKHLIEVDRNLWSRGRGPIAASKIMDEALANLSAGAASK